MWAIILLYVTAVTYCGALLVSVHHHKKWLVVSLFLALLPLIAFKYYNFLNDSTREILSSFSISYGLPGLNWAIPIGISFYTFQTVGYFLDVYHKRIAAERNWWDYMLFVSFFPQILSGPISRAEDLLPQIKKERQFDYNQNVAGLKALLWGMFMKCVFADRIAIYADTIFNNYSHLTAGSLWFGSFAYTLQIYGDFAGYSLMAVGVGKCLGFDLISNFKRPYFASSITEFWKRWHISLTRWLTTHIYIAMGGNRCSRIRQYWNIIVTFLVSGIWHGANWTFIVWGLIHGIIQVIEKMLGLDPKGINSSRGIIKRLKPLRIIATFVIVDMAWIFFRQPTIRDAFNYVMLMFSKGDITLKSEYPTQVLLILALVIVIIKEIVEEYFPSIQLFNNRNAVIRWGTYLAVLCMIALFGVLDSTQFIYVSF